MAGSARVRGLFAADRVERLRPVWVGLTAVLLVLAAIEAAWLARIIADQQGVGVDLRFFQFVARRWLDTGVFYTDRQLSGPYQTQTLVDNLYPPHALYLFIPFLVLPWPLWWGIPLGIVAWVIWWARPAAWAWPILAACVLFPKTFNQVIYGNTDMWVCAFIALGVRFGWPATLITFKPSLVFFAVIGIRSRAWWVAAAVLVALSLPFVALLAVYPSVILHSTATALYSLSNLPFFALPVIAWAASTRRGTEPWRSWLGRLLDSRRAA